MSDESGEPAGGAPPEVTEPVRVLVPSRLGYLGVEFRSSAITRIVIAPTGKIKRLYFPLADYEESEYLDEVFGRLSEYLAGARRSPDLVYRLDNQQLDTFSRRVLRETSRTPYGRTRTYKEIAEASGRPQAYRQVMVALERNPLPLLIPCHRIVPSRSGIGKWVGGSQRKRWLLKMEKESAPSLVGQG